VEVKIDPSVDMKMPPKVQVDTMPAAKFFAYAAELLKVNPPHITDQPIIAQLQRIGFEVGKSFDLDKAAPTVRKALESAPGEAQQLMTWKVPTLARVASGWSMNTDTMGVYGNYYLKRAIVTQFGLGANLPEDAIYPINLADEAGKPLDGANNYNTSTKVRHRQRTPFGPSRSMTPKASKLRTRSIGLRSAVGCRSSTTRMDRWTFTSRTKVPVQTKRLTGFQPRKGRLI
jgi:hypothetical protein